MSWEYTMLKVLAGPRPCDEEDVSYEDAERSGGERAT
jgi:hypothetical protein